MTENTNEVVQGQFKTIIPFKKLKSDGPDGHFLGFIEGLASTPDLDRDTEIISEKALRDAPQQLLNNDAVFFNHQHRELPLGKVLDAGYVKGQGLYVKVGISKNHPNVWQAIEEGSLKSFSIAGEFVEWENQSKDIDGKEMDIRVITKVDLYEVSVVGIPANPNANFTPLIQKYFINSASTAEDESVSVETKTKQEGIIMEPNTEKDGQDPSPTESEIMISALSDKVDVISESVEKNAELSSKTAELFNKFLEVQSKPNEPEEPKGTVPRDTVQRQDQTPGRKFANAREYEMYELEEFAKALLHPSGIKIDMYGTLKHTTPKGYPRLFE